MSIPGGGQQRPQHGLGRLLVLAMLGRGRRGAERLFQERDADPLRPADLLEGGGRPRLALAPSRRTGLSRTEMTLPSSASPGDRLVRGTRLLLRRRLGAPGQTASKARPNAASTCAACAGSNRSTAAVFCPSARRISSSRMNRVTDIQKSSRTISSAWTRPPSHWRRAWTSSASSVARLACSHCSNWSSTIRTFCPGEPRPAAARRGAAAGGGRPAGPGMRLRRPRQPAAARSPPGSPRRRR